MSKLTDTIENPCSIADEPTTHEIFIKVENVLELIENHPNGAALTNEEAEKYIKMNNGSFNLITKAYPDDILVWREDTSNLPENYTFEVDSIAPLSPGKSEVLTVHNKKRFYFIDEEGDICMKISPKVPSGTTNVKYNGVILLTDPDGESRLYSWDPGIDVHSKDSPGGQ
ncbi:hypothetical protein [Xanthovirga aplysinae]|uniref:hypothetical protein n=1 Tax=Xanthovirga aplysinae TaxID=2529853 RepID=UPI0012BC715C|nr:hypothetical protein [Xanthovirga aplysinae]MTI33638.1 hypothetical protein [Xanthovirga aplysinae]